MDSVSILLGAGTGFLVGLTGVGGGALMTPLLLLMFGVAPAMAVGTDLWFAALTKLVATPVYQHHGSVDWPIVKRLWLGSLPATALTLAAMQTLMLHAGQDVWLRQIIAIAVLLTASGLMVRAIAGLVPAGWRGTRQLRFSSVTPQLQAGLTVLAGAVMGIVVTLTSIGAGVLGAMCLMVLYPQRLTPPRLLATDVVHAMPLAMFAGLGHLWMGHLDWGLLGQLLLGSIPGILLGAKLSGRLPHPWLRGTLAGMLLLLGLKLWPKG